MSSATDIWNAAVARCSGTLISGTGQDEIVEEELFNLMYPMERDAVLSARDWSFNRRVITVDADPALHPALGYPQFAIPSDSLRIWRVDVYPDFRSVSDSFHWEIVDNMIVSEDANDSVFVRYGATQNDTTKYTKDFIHCLTLKCAAALALPLKQSTALRESLLAEYEDALPDAAALDGMQGVKQNFKRGKLLRARVR